MTMMDLEGRRASTTTGLRPLLTLALSALGIVYADIGTSPLYVLSGIFPASGGMPSNEDVVGGVSAILWTVTLLPLVKYSLISLSFGTHEGEGGVYALYMGLFPREAIAEDGRALTGFSTKESSVGDSDEVRPRFGENLLRRMKVPLLVWAFFGVSLVLADGILTPAVSVVSAVGGIAVAKPTILDAVVPVSIAFLVILFLVQRFGTHKIGLCFGPVCLLWHLLLASTGIYNIIQHPAIFRAIDPSRAIMFFVRTKRYDALSGVILAVTGCEAIFANLGQFTPMSIRLGFFLAYIALVFAYLGQGAALIVGGEPILASPFYLSIPGPTGGPLYWIIFITAILACLIASQTMITASFSLLQQLVSMNCFPAIRMRYTSDTKQGQVYFPAINYLLLVAVIGTVAGFGTEYALTNAYGAAVSTVLVVTTTFLSLQIVYVKRWSWLIAIAFSLPFLFIEGAIWGACMKKVPHGAWFSLAIGGVLLTFMSFFSWGRHLEDVHESKGFLRLSRLIFRSPEPHQPKAPEKLDLNRVASQAPLSPRLGVVHLPRLAGPSSGDQDIAEDEIDDSTGPLLPLSTLDERLWLESPGEEDRLELPRISTVAIFHKSSSSSAGVPRSFYAFLRRWPSLPRVVIFLSTRVVGVAHVHPEDRYLVTKTRSLEGFYGVTMRVGYRDDRSADIDAILQRITPLEHSFDPKGAEEKLSEIKAAADHCTTHVLPNYLLLSKRAGSGPIAFLRRVLIEELYARVRMVFPDETSAQKGDEEILQVGIIAQI